MNKLNTLFSYIKYINNNIYLNPRNFNKQLNCYPRKCLCSYNLNYMSQNHFNSWKDTIIKNNKWCFTKRNNSIKRFYL